MSAETVKTPPSDNKRENASQAVNIPFIILGKGGLVYEPGHNPQICPQFSFHKCASGTITIRELWNLIWGDNFQSTIDQYFPLNASVTVYNDDQTTTSCSITIYGFNGSISIDNDTLVIPSNVINFSIY